MQFDGFIALKSDVTSYEIELNGATKHELPESQKKMYQTKVIELIEKSTFDDNRAPLMFICLENKTINELPDQLLRSTF